LRINEEKLKLLFQYTAFGTELLKNDLQMTVLILFEYLDPLFHPGLIEDKTKVNLPCLFMILQGSTSQPGWVCRIAAN
jgi:hypothetical protein